MIGLTVDVLGMDAVQKKLSALSRDLQPKALQPAINKVASKARAEINRTIPKEFNVKAAEVRNSIEIRKARSGKIEASITVFGSSKKRGRSLNMIHFLAAVQAAGQAIKVRGSKASKREMAGLEAQLGFLIKRGGGLKKIQGAFIGNKGRTVFMREGNPRLPIKPVQVVGFSQMVNSKRVNRQVLDKITTEMPIELDRSIKLILDRN